MPVVKYNAPSTGIGWLDSLFRAAHEDPTAGLSPMPLAGAGASMVSPGARELLKVIGRLGGRDSVRRLGADVVPLARPAEQLPMPIARAQSEMGDMNIPQYLMDQGDPGDMKHYLRLVNRILQKPNPAGRGGDQSDMYEMLLAGFLRGGLQ